MEEKLTYKKVPYYYVIDIVIAAGGGNVQQVLTIDDHDFVMKKVSRTATGIFNILLTTTMDDRQISNARVNDDNFFGAALAVITAPYELPAPKTLKARTVVTFDVTDTSAAPNTLQIVLHGYKKVPIA